MLRGLLNVKNSDIQSVWQLELCDYVINNKLVVEYASSKVLKYT